MAKSLLLFDFEHINEDQLKDVIERVKRDRRRRRENAAWLAYSSRNKEEIRSKTDLSTSNLTEREHRVPKILYQSSLEDDKMEKYESMQESVDYLQILGQKEDNILLMDDKPEFRHILQKICSIRRSISVILDSILAQSELKFLREFIVRGAPAKFEESENIRRIMNYRYRILGLDYQMVMSMRKLSKNITINNVFLGNLCKCHSTALKLLQVFVLGWCDLMKMNQIKEKFRDLMKSVITLSRVCKTICGGLNDLDDFLIDVLSTKCSIILHTVDKEFSEKNQKKCSANVEEELKEERKECSNKKKLSNKSINLKSKDDLVSIPVKAFKKLAKKHFNGLETRIKEEKNVKILTHDKNSRKPICPYTKMSQGKKVKHLSNAIHIKSSVNTIIEGEGNRKSDSSSKKQDNSHFETEMKNFDIESFSKKLYSTLEKEICSNLKCIFNNLSFGQLQIFQAAGQSNGRHVFYHDNHLELLEKLKKSLNIPVLEEIPLEIECGNLHREKEDTESNIDSPKQNEDSSSLKIKEDGYMALQRRLSDHQTRPKPPLQLIAGSQNSKNSSLEQHITRQEKPSSSGNRISVGDDRKELLGATVRSRTVHSAQGMEPLVAIDRISEKLIAECLKSFSSELDYCILQNIFDQEFL